LRCPVDHSVEHVIDTEVAQRGTEEHPQFEKLTF
jgi:hypothetical protein